MKMQPEEVKANTGLRGKQHRESVILRSVVEMGIGCVVSAAAGIILLIVSFTPLYRADGMRDYVGAIRFLAIFFLSIAAIVFVRNRWSDV